MRKALKENFPKENFQKEQADDMDEEIDQYFCHPQQEVEVDREQTIIERSKEIQNIFKKRVRQEKPAFHEHMSIISREAINIQNLDINNDIQREVQFYNITKENIQVAMEYLSKEQVSVQRPDDYLADMFKSDKLMANVKNKLVQQQVKIQNFEEKRQRADQKKIKKIVEKRNNVNKQKEKQNNIKGINEWKQEIKNKGDQAKDLNEFLKPKKNVQKQNKTIHKNKGFGDKERSKFKGRFNQNFSKNKQTDKTDNYSSKSSFKTGNQKLQKYGKNVKFGKKQLIQGGKRKGKQFRNNQKNKKGSSKGGKRR